ncbi:MAG: amino acid adenylation domain-containing protein [Holophagales bacterium]|nr:amino acid adenylation domain-containing protein [Holophagales bacterium]
MKVENLEDLYTLSPMQQGILFHALRSPGAGVYIEQLDFTFRGQLEAGTFRAAWQRVLDRHTCLRSSFHWRKVEKPMQAGRKRVELPLVEHDLRHQVADAQEAHLRAFLDDDRDQGFDPTAAPLMRLHLFRTGDQAYRFLWSFHHLILDGWSFSLVLQDFLTFYKALYHGQPLDLGPAPPYRDYIAWLKKQDRASAEDYWRRNLAGFDEPSPIEVALPGGYRPASRASHDKRQIHLAELAEPLADMARRHQLTLNTLVQGAWAILSSRYSGRSEVLFGTTVANRPASLPGAERMVGMLISTLPVRCRVAADAEVLPWLQELQRQLAEIRGFEHCSLVDIQGWSELPSSRRMFDSIVVFENVPLPEVQLEKERLEVGEYVYDGRPHYPLNLVILPGDELPVRLIFDQRRFAPQAIDRLLGHLRTLLASLVENDGGRLGELSMLDESERAAATAPAPRAEDQGAALHRRFAEQARRHPQRLAVVDGERRLTYRQLESRAALLARRLRRHGAGPGQIVGVCLERSAEVVVAILACLESGAAYLPLDPDYPRQRLDFLLEDSGVRLLVTEEGLRGRIEAAEVITIDRDAPADEQATLGSIPGMDDASLPAYVIYTSGSTGKPKGVLVSHENVGRLFDATEPWFGFDERDVWSFFHSYAFDFSVWEIWGALLYGGRTVVVPHAISRSPRELRDLLAREGVTVLSQTPSAFSELLRIELALPADDLLPLRKIVFGGEELDVRALAPWIERYGDRPGQLINMYGITETTVHVTYRPIREKDCRLAKASPVGQPIPDLEVFLLDGELNPVPVGVAAEIYVGGAGLAYGYLGRGALTARRFVPHPFSERGGERLYRTGDLARWTEEGELEFLGRMDRQVQLMGFRIELGEVEAALLEQPRVVASVARVHEDAERGPRLFAYVVGEEGSELDGAALRRALQQSLPAHMVPSLVTVLDHLPLTAHGKIDTAALPRPERQRDEGGYAEPRSELERQLCALWERLLEVRPVGIHDSFFELGGHSLLAMRMAGCVQKDLGLDLALADFFAAPTVAATARRLQGDGDGAPSILVPLSRAAAGRPLFCAFPATGQVVCYLEMARRLEERPVFGLQAVEGIWYRPLPEQAAELVAAVRRAAPVGPYLLAGWSTGGVLAFEMARQLRAAGEVVEGLYLIDTWAPVPEILPQRVDDDLLLGLFARNLAGPSGPSRGFGVEQLRHLGAGGLDGLWRQARRMDLLPEGMDRRQVEHLYRVFAANLRAVIAYAPEPYTGPLTLLRTAERLPEQRQADLAGPDLGWRRFAGGTLVETVPGSHFSVMREPHVDELATRIAALLPRRDGVPV